jgi:hypothetical protein
MRANGDSEVRLRANRTPRRFTLIDAILLIAATAVGLALWRPSLELTWAQVNRIGLHSLRLSSYWVNIAGLTNLFGPWSVALLILSLIKPRPQIRRLVLRPAAIVGAVASLTLSIWVVLFALLVGVKGQSAVSLSFAQFQISLFLPSQVALALASVWFVQALGRRCRPTRNWLDRLGWALGVSWFVFGFSLLLMRLLALL